MDIQGRAFRHNVLIAVAVLFTLIVFLYLRHICRGFQVLISGYGTVYSIISCHRIFVLSLGFADSGELRRGTFSKCNNPLLHFHPYWLQSAVGSPRALPRGNAVTAVTSADQGKNVCAFSHGQPVCMKLFCGTFLADGGSENRIFHCLSIGSTAVRLWGREMRGAVAGASLLPSLLPYNVVSQHIGKLQYFLVSDAFPL